MRYSGIIILSIAILAGCKTASVTSTSATEYSEDLSVLRPELKDEKLVEPEVGEGVSSTEPVVFNNHIKTELDSVNQRIIQKNKDQKYVDGYTIQIYTGNDRQAADEARNRAIQVDPTLNPKISYHQPSYKVKAGQYTNRLEAHEVFSKIKKEFPLALLIPERIVVDYD